MTKMAKINTLFMIKTVKTPPFGAAHINRARIREFPRGAWPKQNQNGWLRQCFLIGNPENTRRCCTQQKMQQGWDIWSESFKRMRKDLWTLNLSAVSGPVLAITDIFNLSKLDCQVALHRHWQKYCIFMANEGSRSINKQRKNLAHFQLSWPKKLG